MISDGEFEEHGTDPAPVRGSGTLAIEAEGLYVRSETVQMGLVLTLGGLLASLAMIGAVIATMGALDEHGLISDGDSLKPAVAAGMVALVGTFLLTTSLLRRVLPLRQLDRLIPYQSIASATLEGPCLVVVSTADGCLGRITFRSPEATSLFDTLQQHLGARASS